MDVGKGGAFFIGYTRKPPKRGIIAKLVPRARLELASFSPADFKSAVYAHSTISAEARELNRVSILTYCFVTTKL